MTWGGNISNLFHVKEFGLTPKAYYIGAQSKLNKH